MIVKNNKPDIVMFLAKPDKTVIGKLKHTTNKSLTEKSDEVDELTFALPYKITVDGETIRNPHIDTIKDRFLIKTVFKGKTKWFLIDGIKKSSSDTDELEVRCFLLPYQLQYDLILDYEVTGYNCKMVSDDILKGTGWATGYVNPEFNLKYRRFEITSQTKLAAIYEIEEAFDAVVIFDTVEQTVNYYKEEEVSNYKGFSIGYGKYIQNIEEDLDAGEIVTRLYVTGSDGITINSVNPTGQSYIDDFSYFLYPFKMNTEGKVIKHSDYMSDELATGLVTYNKTISDNKTGFSNLLSEKREWQIERTGYENDLKDGESELQIILDAIVIAKRTGQSTAQLTNDRDNKNKEINSLKGKIKSIDGEIDRIDAEIELLRQSMRLDNFLNKEGLEELSKFIQAEEWSDDNMFDVNDLYEAGLKHLSEVNKPVINITTNLVNFMQMISEKHNWDRFDVWDIVRIDHEKLDMDIKVPITEINYQFDSEEIGVTVSDNKEAKDIEEEIRDLFYTVGRLNTDYNKRKLDWSKIAYNFNIRNDRIEELPIEPTNTVISHKENDDGSVNLELDWSYPEHSDTNKNEHNIDGFLIYMYFDESDEPYQFTSKISQETIVDVSLYTNSYVFPSVPSNLYYTVGIRAYRRVDDDIDLDGILMSEIVRFKQNETRTMSLFQSVPEDEETIIIEDPYLPNSKVNIRGLLNGTNIKSGHEPPENPEIDDVWIDLKEFKLKIWNGEKWSGDTRVEGIEDRLDFNDGKFDESYSELQSRLEEAKEELEVALNSVDEEVKRIEEEVIPRVETAEENSHIPESVIPPDEIPASKLWWDTSQDPARLMRWDVELADWTTLAPTESEIEEIMNKMREDAVVESRRYSKLEIIKTRNRINDRIDNEIGDVIQKAQELEELGEQLQQLSNDTQEYIDNLIEEVEGWGDLVEIVDSHSSHIEQTDSVLRQTVGRVTVNEDRIEETETQIEQNADEIALRATKTEVEHIDGEIQNITEDISSLSVRADAIESEVSRVETDLDGRLSTAESNITQTADQINQRVTDFEAIYESDKTDILSNIERNETEINQLSDEINLRVTKDEWENTNDDFDARITSAEGTLTVHSDAIAQMVTQSQLTNYVDYSTYNSKVSSLETSINGITGRVSDVEAEIDTVTNDITSATARIGTLEITSNNITSTVESLETDLGVANQAISSIDQKADGIISTVTSIQTDVGNLESDMTAVQTTITQLPDEINLMVTEGIDALEIGGRNLAIGTATDGFTSYIRAIVSIIDSNPTKIVRTECTTNGIFGMAQALAYRTMRLEEGKEYTLSFEARGNVDLNYVYIMHNGTSNQSLPSRRIPSESEFTRLTFPFTKLYDAETSFVMISARNGVVGDWFEVRNIKVEKGTVATDWTPAPEDQVDKTNVLSSIYLSTEGVKIQGSKIDIEGVVSFINSDNSSATMIDGGRIVGESITANQLNINNIFGNSAVIGKIQSDSIATANLDASKITTGTLDASKISVVNLSANSITSGEIDASRLKAGSVIASDITFTGTLNGADGTFSGTVSGGLITGSKFTTSGDGFFGGNSQVTIEGGGISMNSPIAYSSLNGGGYYYESDDYNMSVSIGPEIGGIYVGEFRHGSNTGAIELIPTTGIRTNRALRMYGATGPSYGIEFPAGHTISVASVASGDQHFRIFGNRARGQYPFSVRSHSDGLSYRDDFYISPQGAIYTPPTFHNTTTSSPTLRVGTSAGHITRSTSARRFKLSIEDAKDYYKILDVKPRTWYDKGDVERYADALTKKASGENYSLERVEHIKRIGGLIAEEVEDAGLEHYVDYDENGQVNGIAYDRLWTLLIPIVKELKEENEEQNDKIQQLRHTNQLRTSQMLQLKQRIEQLEDLVL